MADHTRCAFRVLGHTASSSATTSDGRRPNADDPSAARTSTVAPLFATILNCLTATTLRSSGVRSTSPAAASVRRAAWSRSLATTYPRAPGGAVVASQQSATPARSVVLEPPRGRVRKCHCGPTSEKIASASSIWKSAQTSPHRLPSSKTRAASKSSGRIVTGTRPNLSTTTCERPHASASQSNR